MDELESHLSRQIEHSRDFFWHRLRWKAVLDHLPRDRPFELVDVGAGAGLVGEFLARDLPQASYRFVEPIPALERRLEERHGRDANARSDPTYAGAAVVVLLDVLEHQVDDRSFMAELAERLDEGASVLLTVPALMGLWSHWDEALGHYRRYDKRTLARALEGSSLALEELDYLFPELILPAWVRRRRQPAGQTARPQGSADFPDLSRTMNAALYGLGAASLRLRRIAPAGTSLMAVCRRS
jgi:hypothetical protein